MGGRQWQWDRSWGRLRNGSQEIVEFGQLLLPFFPLFFGNKEVVSHIAEELYFHDVNFLDCNARNLGPCLVRVCVIIEDSRLISSETDSNSNPCLTFIPQHESYCEQPIFATLLSAYARVELFQSVDK